MPNSLSTFCYVGPFFEQPLILREGDKYCDNPYCKNKGVTAKKGLIFCDLCKKTLLDLMVERKPVAFEEFSMQTTLIRSGQFVSVTKNRVWLPCSSLHRHYGLVHFCGASNPPSVLAITPLNINESIENFKSSYKEVIVEFGKIYGYELHVKFGIVTDIHIQCF